jgi:WD40 repeat protein
MIRVWDLETDSVRVLKNSKGKEYPYWLKFSEDGSLFTCNSQGSVQRWNIRDGSSTVIGNCKLPYASGLAVSRDARFLFADFISNYQWGATTVGEVVEFDLQKHTSCLLKSHGNTVADVALDPTERFVVTASLDGAVRVGPVTGEEPHMLLAPDGMNTIAISPDGKWIASGSVVSFALRLWRMPEGRPIHTLPHDEFLNRLRALTNVRVVADKSSQTGYRLDKAPFPGWEKAPTW